MLFIKVPIEYFIMYDVFWYRAPYTKGLGLENACHLKSI
jgi:hypothetical protein